MNKNSPHQNTPNAKNGNFIGFLLRRIFWCVTRVKGKKHTKPGVRFWMCFCPYPSPFRHSLTQQTQQKETNKKARVYA